MTGAVDLAGLLPDPAAEWAYRRVLCREAYERGWAAAWEAGRRALLGELAAAQRAACSASGVALAGPQAKEMEVRRYGDGGRLEFARPRPGDFPGRVQAGKIPGASHGGEGQPPRASGPRDLLIGAD